MSTKPPLITAAQAAARLGCDKSTVIRHANRHGIGLAAGPGTPRYFSPADLARLKKLVRPRRGNPNFVPGNRFGQPPAPARKKLRKKSRIR